MKIVAFLIIVLIQVSCTSKKKVEMPQVRYPVDQELLDVQIQADKANDKFISNGVTAENLSNELAGIPLLEGPGLTLLYKYVKFNQDREDALNWSKAIAKKRYATTDDERLELVHLLLKAAIQKKDFAESSEIFDCKNLKFVFKGSPEDDVVLSMYPSFVSKSKLWSIEKNKDQANKKIIEFKEKFLKEAKDNNQSSFKLLLLGTTRQSRKIQFCELKSLD